MRILFLDFDGVIHPVDASSQQLFCWIPTLRHLLSDFPDVRIVVHSSWRYEYSDDEIRQLLSPIAERFAGTAPRMRREQAIETVLQSNKQLVTSYLVLDDDPREFAGGTLDVLFCESSTGISAEPVQQSLFAWLVRTQPEPSPEDIPGRRTWTIVRVIVRAVSPDVGLVRADGMNGQQYLLNKGVMRALWGTVNLGDELELLLRNDSSQPSKVLRVSRP